MKNPLDDLPNEIRERFESFLRIGDDGNVDVVDPTAFVDFLYENAERYPALREFLKVDEEKLTKHIEETGDVPPGVTVIQKTAVADSNVTKVRIVHGPGRLPTDDPE